MHLNKVSFTECDIYSTVILMWYATAFNASTQTMVNIKLPNQGS